MEKAVSIVLLVQLLFSGCSYRMVLPPKFKPGDCIQEKYVNARYRFLITRSAWGLYVHCQTDPDLNVWYACDVKEKGIFQDIIDENYEKVSCPNKPFDNEDDKKWYESNVAGK